MLSKLLNEFGLYVDGTITFKKVVNTIVDSASSISYFGISVWLLWVQPIDIWIFTLNFLCLIQATIRTFDKYKKQARPFKAIHGSEIVLEDFEIAQKKYARKLNLEMGMMVIDIVMFLVLVFFGATNVPSGIKVFVSMTMFVVLLDNILSAMESISGVYPLFEKMRST